jgi:hypothetical protein
MNHEMLYHAATARRQTLLAEAERERLLSTASTSQPVRVLAFPSLLQRARNIYAPTPSPVCCPSH